VFDEISTTALIFLLLDKRVNNFVYCEERLDRDFFLGGGDR
jgi:hypothetical protein